MRFLSVFSLLVGLFVGNAVAAPSTVDNHIKIDQFGYRCNDQKIAVISNPQTGFNAGSPFTPSTGVNQYQIRNWDDDIVVFTGTLTPWNAGATHTQSGDKVWWFDFSTLSTPGSYYVFDVSKNVGSYKFEIRDDVYENVLKVAVRSFYYQRCGVGKLAPHAETGYTDTPCHIGALQDADCRLYNNTSPVTSKNLSGGWHDAGDYNKYVNFAWEPVMNLLNAYEENPTVWSDDFNIPESGNGIPDILDEIKVEMDWLLKMQQSNGSVLCVIGGGSGSPPSADSDQRVYGPATTSASFTAASLFAKAAIIYQSLGDPVMTTYASTLQTAAENAYNWAVANPNITFYNQPNNVAAGEQEFSAGSYAYDVLNRRIAAATFLYKLTNTAAYRTYVESNYTTVHLYQWSFAYPFETTEQDVLLYFSNLVGVTPTVKSNIQNRYSNSVSASTDNLPSFNNNLDAYRAYLTNANHTWGSNSIKCRMAMMFLNQNTYNLNTTNALKYTQAASGYLHYMHGVNPLALVYLTNMLSHGAENSVREFYHSWFTDGSALWDRVGLSTYGPAPGFVPGGPNPNWSLDGCCPSGCGSTGNNSKCVALSPPGSQPILKSFLEWNSSWPQNSWSVTENSLGYNASYVRLLSHFMTSGTCGTNLPSSLLDKNFESKLAPQISIYPNPFKDNTIIEIESNAVEVIQLRVLNAQGLEVIPIQLYSTGSKIEIGETLIAGVYIIEIKHINGVSTHKLIKN